MRVRIDWLIFGSLVLPALTALVASESTQTLDRWTVQSSVIAVQGGSAYSSPAFNPKGWYSTSVPTTVLSALIKNKVYPDLRAGLNAYQIPDSNDEFNAKYDLARFSRLPGQRNPWRDPYWFRTEFRLASVPSGQRLWLHLDAINYRAEVWVNGSLVASATNMAGMFQRFHYDITANARQGANAVAVKIFPVDHPGMPQKQVQVLGPDRQYQSELMKDVTEIVSIGYDCMMTVPDRNMGLWQEVWLEWTGPVAMRDPFVVTELPLPETNRATLKISTDLLNATDEPIRGILKGRLKDTDMQFEQPVELAPNETKRVMFAPNPVLQKPRLWWPANYGEQHLYDLLLSFESDGKVSHEQTVSFGVRQVGYEMHELNGFQGRRLLINGQRILCRGGYIQPELLFDWDSRRMETEIAYYAGANLNLIYFEDIPNPPEPFLRLCDKYGVLFGNVMYSCYWLRPGTPYPTDFPLLERCTVDVIKRYRNHPSLVMYMAMNEEDTKKEVYEMWRKHLLELDGSRWFIPSAYFPSDRKNVPEWFKKDLPAGMTDKGASYSWAEPEQYYRWVREARNWMFMMESGSASLPPMSSLVRFLPEASQPAPASAELFPLNEDWAHHGANQYFKGYDSALRRLHGEPQTVADYAWKGHLVTADQHRSMFEAVNHRLWDITSGFTQWKINACEPSVQWQIFDWYLKPMVSYYYIKKACEPLHIQLNLLDRKIGIINTQFHPEPDLQVRARVFDLAGKPLWEQSGKSQVEVNAPAESFSIPEPAGITPVYFVKLELHRNGKLASENFYWLRRTGTSDYRSLQELPLTRVTASCSLERHGPKNIARVKVSNPTSQVAFFIQLALTKGSAGPEILPVSWDDNYFSLLPGEAREITAAFSAEDAKGSRPTLQVGGWNIATDFDCASISLPAAPIKAGQPFSITAMIRRTFLDGSRIPLSLDDRPVGYQWAWAQSERPQVVSFQTVVQSPGAHEFRIGKKKISLSVLP